MHSTVFSWLSEKNVKVIDQHYHMTISKQWELRVSIFLIIYTITQVSVFSFGWFTFFGKYKYIPTPWLLYCGNIIDDKT